MPSRRTGIESRSTGFAGRQSDFGSPEGGEDIVRQKPIRLENPVEASLQNLKVPLGRFEIVWLT